MDRRTETESTAKSGKSHERHRRKCKSKKRPAPPPKTCEELAKEKKQEKGANKAEQGGQGKAKQGKDGRPSVQNKERRSTGQKSMKGGRKALPKITQKVSNLVFVMPKEADPQAKVQAASEKKIGKLMRYMKKYWSIHVDKDFYPVKVDFRMPDRMTHQRPENWWLVKRARQKTLEHTGFFSNVREPYHDLGPPELDTSMLVFKNMHEDLLIDPTKFIQDRQLKEELVEKCNAPLVRLPRTRVRRPHYNKGRVKIGAGGMLNIDKYVKTGYDFQNGIRGGVSYTLTLDNYMEQKENEIADLASAFGVVVKKQPPKPTEGEAGEAENQVPGAAVNQLGRATEVKHVITALQLASDHKKNSSVDDRATQRNLTSLEQMMMAIYVMIRSVLNMKMSQLEANHPLPLRVVQAIRSTSPVVHLQRKAKKKTVTAAAMPKSCKDSARQTRATTSAVVASGTAGQMRGGVGEGELGEGENEEDGWEYAEEYEDGEIPSAAMSIKALIHHRGEAYLGAHDANDPVHEEHIAATIIDTVKKAHAEKDTSDELEEKVKNIRESPEQATLRMEARDEAYGKLFGKGDPARPPIWKNINVDIVFTIESSSGPEAGPTEAEDTNKEMEAFHAAHDSMGKLQLPSTQKIPYENEIPTPKLPGMESPPKIDSEEQSRLDLLQKNPDAGKKDPPPSPVAHLYKVAGIKTNERQMFHSLVLLKKRFRATEKSLRFYYANEVEKEDWETQDRFKRKIKAILPCPIYERSIAIMRRALEFGSAQATESSAMMPEHSDRRPALWYRKLRERCDETGATRHLGCNAVLIQLFKYCDVDMRSRPRMLNRFCLLIVSLPTTELATRPWQLAIKFLMDHLLGSPVELFYQWLEYRGLPCLL